VLISAAMLQSPHFKFVALATGESLVTFGRFELFRIWYAYLSNQKQTQDLLPLLLSGCFLILCLFYIYLLLYLPIQFINFQLVYFYYFFILLFTPLFY